MKTTTARDPVRQTGKERLREWALAERPPLSIHILVVSAFLLMTASAQALQPEVLYSFQLGLRDPLGRLVEGSDGNFYGTTLHGGNHGLGTVFRVTTNGLATQLISFTRANGAYPEAGLVLGSDGNFYGTTSQGGSSGYGTVFRVTSSGVLTTLVSFNSTVNEGSGAYINTNGADPEASLVLGIDSNFYGTTRGGGSSGYGTLFRITTNGVLTTLVSFNNANGAYPEAGLVQGHDGNFYGTTAYGGSGAHGPWTGAGTVFKVTTNGVLTSLVSFTGVDGANPYAGLIQGNDGNLYGTTVNGGSSDRGTVFKVTTNGVLTSLVSFTGTNGGNPQAELVLGSDGDLFGTTYSGLGNGTVFRVTTDGVLTTLIAFNGDNGRYPQAGLVVGSDGNFYGTTASGGSSDYGTMFKITTSGALTLLVSFADPNGANPSADLVRGSNGSFYGTSAGEFYSRNSGTVFKVTTNGLLTTLVSFNPINGALPNELVLGSDGNFYGTTQGGSISNDEKQLGTVFQMTSDGVLTTLVSFSGTNGAYPQSELVLGGDGNFYGTTFGGGNDVWGLHRGNGTVFMVTTNGVLTSLVLFTRTNGANPQAGLVLDRDGILYGTTARGGSSDLGTVFRMTTGGVLTSLVSFTGTNGASPVGGLVFGSDGNFYGTTVDGGTGYIHASQPGSGTVFKVTTNGVLTSLVSFTGTNGGSPQARLFLGNDGAFYGTTAWGGSSYVIPGNFGYGTVFRVTTRGVLTTLVSFTGDNGARPLAGLVLGNDGSFYGTTSEGGLGGGGTLFRLVVSAFTSVARQPGGEVFVAGTGPTKGGYRLWASADLSLPLASWTLLRSASFDGNGNFSYTDASAATNTSHFYQLSVP